MAGQCRVAHQACRVHQSLPFLTDTLDGPPHAITITPQQFTDVPLIPLSYIHPTREGAGLTIALQGKNEYLSNKLPQVEITKFHVKHPQISRF